MLISQTFEHCSAVRSCNQKSKQNFTYLLYEDKQVNTPIEYAIDFAEKYAACIHKSLLQISSNELKPLKANIFQ